MSEAEGNWWPPVARVVKNAIGIRVTGIDFDKAYEGGTALSAGWGLFYPSPITIITDTDKFCPECRSKNAALAYSCVNCGTQLRDRREARNEN